MSRAPADLPDRRGAQRSGGRRAGDPSPLPIDPENLDALIDALERFAGAIPPGRALFTAIYEPGAGASDLIIRDRDGDTRLILGLENAQHHRLETLLAWVRGELDRESRDVGLAREMARGEPDPAGGEPSMRTHRLEPPGLDYRAVLEQSPFPLLLVGRDETIEYASPAVVNRLGMRDPAQLIGMSLADVVHPGDWGELSALIGQAPNEDDPPEVRLLRWDGLHSRAEVTFSVLPGGDSIVLALTPLDGGQAGADRSGPGAGAERWQMRTNTELSVLER